MRVFLAGASGAIGTRLVPQLIAHGHEVIGTHHSPATAERVRKLGATPVQLDLLDAAAVRRAVVEAEPAAIIHQATALADVRDFRNFDRSFAQTNRLRTAGTDALLAAAREAGVRRFIAQSYASGRYARTGGPVKTEDDPLEPVRKRMFPIVGNGDGVTSFIHLDDAAAATVIALEHDSGGIFHVVDDDPAPLREWLPVLARVLGAKPPLRVPRWLARLFAGEAAVVIGTESRGASNAKAKRELGWQPRFPSWREGFVAAYGGAVR